MDDSVFDADVFDSDAFQTGDEESVGSMLIILGGGLVIALMVLGVPLLFRAWG